MSFQYVYYDVKKCERKRKRARRLRRHLQWRVEDVRLEVYVRDDV